MFMHPASCSTDSMLRAMLCYCPMHNMKTEHFISTRTQVRNTSEYFSVSWRFWTISVL